MVVISLDSKRDLAIFRDIEVIAEKGSAIHVLLNLLKKNTLA